MSSVRCLGTPCRGSRPASITSHARPSTVRTRHLAVAAAHVTDTAVPPEVDVVVVGAGIAGLVAARRLVKAGRVPQIVMTTAQAAQCLMNQVGAGTSSMPCTDELHLNAQFSELRGLCAAGRSVALLEASGSVGGRVQTDEVDGFLLDRGFHIFLTAYPAAKRELDFDALDLKPFYAGALVRMNGSWERYFAPHGDSRNSPYVQHCKQDRMRRSAHTLSANTCRQGLLIGGSHTPRCKAATLWRSFTQMLAAWNA